MYNQVEADKKERRRIIAVATVIVVLILVLLIAIIVVATKKSQKASVNSGQNTSFTISDTDESVSSEPIDDNSDTQEKDEAATTEDGSMTIGLITTKTDESAESSERSNIVRGEVEASSAMPSTGPEDFLPIALMAGMLITYLSSAVLTKREA